MNVDFGSYGPFIWGGYAISLGGFMFLTLFSIWGRWRFRRLLKGFQATHGGDGPLIDDGDARP